MWWGHQLDIPHPHSWFCIITSSDFPWLGLMGWDCFLAIMSINNVVHYQHNKNLYHGKHINGILGIQIWHYVIKSVQMEGGDTFFPNVSHEIKPRYDCIGNHISWIFVKMSERKRWGIKKEPPLGIHDDRNSLEVLGLLAI